MSAYYAQCTQVPAIEKKNEGEFFVYIKFVNEIGHLQI